MRADPPASPSGVAIGPRGGSPRLSMRELASAELREAVAERLAEAVRVRTEIFDGMGSVGEDARWDVYGEFGAWMRARFALVFEKLNVWTVNEHAYLFTWQGSDETKKPLLLMAHFDVVPAPESTNDDWTHPPFAGVNDGEFVWGRGSEDDKSNLVAMLTTVDLLLRKGFVPTRTVILSFGFDEEGGSAGYGARFLADELVKRYGEDGIELIFDEGIAGIEEHFGAEFALPATAEKGYMDVVINVETPGGHSSTPPDHTAIGYLAKAIAVVESNPFPYQLTPQNPTAKFLKQAALHAPDMPENLRSAILNPKLIEQVISYMKDEPERRALIRTSTAVDIVRGGEKTNSLPENAKAWVNHRIAVEHSLQTVKNHYTRILAPLAEQCGLTFQPFGALYGTQRQNGTLILTAQDELEPSPVSDPDDIRFAWLTEVIHSVFGDEIIVAPTLLTGNTDTQFYWKLSSQIHRMSPFRASHDARGTRMHTVDERMPIEGLVEMVRFYHELITTFDGKRR